MKNDKETKGISFSRSENRYRARIRSRGTTVYLGRFPFIDQAVAARTAAERVLNSPLVRR